MKKVLLFLFVLIYFLVPVTAQKLQPLPAALETLQPGNIFPVQPEKGYVFNDRNKDTKPSIFTATPQPGGSPAFTTEVFIATPGHSNVQSSWRSTAAVKKGDVILARLNIRSVYARQESGDALVYFFVQQAVAPFERNVLIELSVGPEWKTVDIPFTSLFDMEAGEASVGFTYGALAQKVEITNIQLLNFGQTATLSQMPATRFTYAGREEEASWRKEALKRIEEIRTAPLVIHIRDAKGKPVKGATVKAQLIDPEFIFGTAVSVNHINGNDQNATNYKKYLQEFFNAVTIDNNLKWPAWMDPAKREATKTAVQWILDNNFRLRGHNLVWPGKKFTPSFYSKQTGFGPSFADSINKHIEHIVTAMKGKVYGWDVINEMIYEKDYFAVMPRTQAAEWFKLARKFDPGATLFINEYSMLNNIASPQNIQTYLGLIKELQNYGAPIDAIGVQGHVGRQPRNPAQVISDLDMFTSTGLPVQITEFDINSPDEELQADYTRDFLIACYSHPVVNGFTMWGFWEAAHWKPDAAMFRKDWTAKPNVAAWTNLVLKQWRTNITQTSAGNGQVNARGHLGRYEITVTNGKSVVKKMYQLTKQAKPAGILLSNK